MSTLIQLTAQIVSAHVSNIQMTSNEMLQELQQVYSSLKALDAGPPVVTNTSTSTESPKLTIKQAFKKDEVICMVCGKGGFKTLKKHLTQAHQLTPRQYRKQFDILSTQKLAAKNYSESRRQMTIDMNLVDGLAKARATKKAAVPLIKTKAPVPMVKEKAAVPAVRIKAPVPAVRMKAAVPAKSAKKK